MKEVQMVDQSVDLKDSLLVVGWVLLTAEQSAVSKALHSVL